MPNVVAIHGWDVWDLYHDKGDVYCFACIETPAQCECGGLSHIQLSEETIDAIEALCDSCFDYRRFELGVKSG